MLPKEFSIIQDLVKCLSGIDLEVFRGKENVIQALHSHLSADILYAQLGRDLSSALDRLRPGCIYEICGLFQLQYILIWDPETDWYLAAGPCRSEKLSEPDIRSQLRELGISLRMGENVIHYLDHVPLVSYEIYHQLGVLLARCLDDTDAPVRYQRIRYDWNINNRHTLLFSDQYAELTQIRQVELRYENSAALTEAVKQGNLSLAYHFLREMSAEADAFTRNPDPLRNRKNLCIVLNTQLRYALEEVGVHPFLLDNVSGAIGMQIEKLQTVEEGYRLVSDTLRQYCELVQEQAYPGLSPFIHLTVTYIKSHLTENITVKETAKALLVNPDYLSHKFHQEMRISFIDFINRERTAQAAALLSRTALQIQQISSAVGYNNTSYFARQFARFYNMTPRDYRKSGAI